MADGGDKFDQDKVPLDLLSSTWLFGVGKVLGFGAKKYAAHNWRKGISQSRLLGAALRHILAHIGGEDMDPESGLLHLHHASCCLMFASELYETRPDLDDRYKGFKKPVDIPEKDRPSCAHVKWTRPYGQGMEESECARCHITYAEWKKEQKG